MTEEVENALLRGQLFLVAAALKGYLDSKHTKGEDGLLHLAVPPALHEKATSALKDADKRLKDQSWTSRTQPIKVGDQVAVSARFLRSIGCYTGDLPQARGVVKELKQVGDVTIAVVDWGKWEVEPKILAKNLSRVTARGIMDHD